MSEILNCYELYKRKISISWLSSQKILFTVDASLFELILLIIDLELCKLLELVMFLQFIQAMLQVSCP